ncbi:HAD-superfamily subfamily IIA hydrolase [Sphaeroforma arctica JP610]|uniref:HAD-superfamily subfamily IIA hydrolase n=1 Tax=Sphaeroforma arctica JP610 TaxID=667725 RepID=A0A0L0G346_9EUKA|nr:HAD-superfamily subfamily IIA hydrolase [Sphaeroforma arctica JP610]KNC83552.1 HAD-superfamily subfamily IIA hydrolase [Sphaeroforma arctica JP610]|eukprot:XP_014157454.1 HAD-superfamily subfamily IIA hydrolase [Sphaeroforma arctica JP610]
MQIMFHGAMKCVFATYAGLVGSTRSSITPLHNSANRRLYSTKNRIVHLDARNCVPGYTSTSRVNKRLYSTNDRKVRLNKGDCVPGFVLDIDGVLIRGDTVIPEAREAMDILTNTTLVAEDGSESKGFPYVFVTNGGGSTEQKKAHQLSEWLNIDVPVEKVILSHTPMRKYTNLYDKNVLLVGQGPLQEIAANYGYKNTWTMEDVVKAYPLLHVMDKVCMFNIAETKEYGSS